MCACHSVGSGGSGSGREGTGNLAIAKVSSLSQHRGRNEKETLPDGVVQLSSLTRIVYRQFRPQGHPRQREACVRNPLTVKRDHSFVNIFAGHRGTGG